MRALVAVAVAALLVEIFLEVTLVYLSLTRLLKG